MKHLKQFTECPHLNDGISASEQNALEQKWLDERLEGICMSDFGDYSLRFYLTADLIMPAQFKDRYHVCRTTKTSRFELSEEEVSELSKVDSVFIFCNAADPSQIAILADITSELDILGADAPPHFLVNHTHHSHQSENKEMDTFVRELLLAGIDGIIGDEHAGISLVWESRLILVKTQRLSSYLSSALSRHRSLAQKAQMLRDCIDATMWGYLRARLAPSIPVVDASLVGSAGKHKILSSHANAAFDVGRSMGEGMSGAVYQLRLKGKASGSVVKMIPKSTVMRISDLRMLKRTISISQQLSKGPYAHPNIVKLHEVLHSPTHILLLMEDAGPENLYELLVRKPLGATKVKTILTQPLEALHHLHSRNICHRDLKPENIIVCDDADRLSLKLVDFDMALEVKPGTKCSSACGTIPFAAPEVLLDQEYDGMQADIWSIGLVMCEVLLGVRSLETKLRLAKVTPGDGEKPRHAVAMVIRGYFQVPGTVLKFVGETCRCQYRHLLPICAPILTGSIRISAEDRWDAAMLYNKAKELRCLKDPQLGSQ